jgi:hypothetical protein
MENLPCFACKRSLFALPRQTPVNGNDYTSSLYHEAGKASSFTRFVNQGGLQIPSTSVFRTIEYCEHVYKATVCGKDHQQINNEKNLKKKIIINVCHHFTLDTTVNVFTDHEDATTNC